MDEYVTMTARINKVKLDIDKILDSIAEDNRPNIDYGWSGSSIDMYVTGGTYGARKAIEGHMLNSSKYSNVTMQNREALKRFNFYLTRGGEREGAGRKPSGKKKRNYYVTDQEHEEIKRLIEKMREGKKDG
jgi:hypothetical protein